MEITKKVLEKYENKVEKSKLSGLYRSKSEILNDKSNLVINLIGLLRKVTKLSLMSL